MINDKARRSAFLLIGPFLLLARAPASAQEYGADMSRFLGVGEDRAEYAATVMPAAGGSPSIVKQEARGSDVVAKSSSEAWTVSGRVGRFELSRSPVIPATGVAVPAKLWDVQGGAGYARQVGDRRRFGLNAAIGSASDQPFLSLRETTALATARYELPSGVRNSWILMLNYSNNRPFLNNVPLPGFAYVIRTVDDRFFAVLGFPFIAARYRPDPDTTLSFNFFGGAAGSLEAARRFPGRLSLYARAERAPQEWLPSGRVDATDRLVFSEDDVRVGARAPVAAGVSADVSVGRAFDRSFFVGRESRDRSDPRATLANCWIAQARLIWRWGPPSPSGR